MVSHDFSVNNEALTLKLRQLSVNISHKFLSNRLIRVVVNGQPKTTGILFWVYCVEVHLVSYFSHCIPICNLYSEICLYLLLMMSHF